MWTFAGANPRRVGHPAPFPEELPRRLIKLYSYPGDLVLDPFAGSGTTLKVARELGQLLGAFLHLLPPLKRLGLQRADAIVVPVSTPALSVRSTESTLMVSQPLAAARLAVRKPCLHGRPITAICWYVVLSSEA